MKIQKETIPLITIILECSNCNIDVENTIKSILNQTFESWELIINLKTSEDEERLQHIDKRLVIYKNLNSSMDIVDSIKSEFILLIKDGILDKTFLEYLYWNVLTNNSSDIVYSCTIKKEKEAKGLPNVILIKKKNLLKINKNFFDNVENIEFWEKVLKNKYNISKLNCCGVFTKQKLENNPIINELNIIKYPVSTNFNYNTYPYIFDVDEIDKGRNEKINLLFVFPWIKLGGADKFNFDLISNFDKNKYNITIITTELYNSSWREKFEEYAEIYDLPDFLKREDWPNFIYNIVKNRNINLVFFSNSFYGYYVLPWLKCKFPKIPFVDFIHAETMEWRNGGYPRESIATSKLLDETYVCSNYLKDLMKEKMDRKKQNVKTIYIGVDINKFDKNNVIIDDYEELKKYKNKKVILFCARLSKEKRPELAIRIFKKVYEEQNKDLFLFIVGDGELRKKCEILVKELNLQDKVIFFGSKEDVRPFYKIATTTLICSLSEGITLTTYESLAMGVPVVSADVGGQSELLNKSDYGILVKNTSDDKDIENYSNALKEILNCENYENISQNCRKQIEDHFSIDIMFRNMENEITNLINNGSKVEESETSNEELYKQYLVMYNQLTQKKYKNRQMYSRDVTECDEITELNNIIKEISDNNFKLNNEIIEIKDKNNILMEENGVFKNELDSVYNSKRWKYLSRIAKIFNK